MNGGITRFGALTSWYSGLAVRDQRVLRFGAVAVLAILLIWVLLPLHRNLAQARGRLQQQQEDLEWMRQVGPTLAAAGPGATAAPTDESIVVLIDRTARESGLGQALTGSTPSGNGGMRVTLETADFNLLVGWLARLSSQHGVRIESAQVTAASAPGIVNASVQLRPRT